MTSFATSSLRFLRRLLHASADPGSARPGVPVVLDGMSGVALMESYISETASLGATYPAAIGARVWDRHDLRDGLNLFDQPAGQIRSNGPRSTLAAATGLSMSGQRSAVFLAGSDLVSAQDLLAMAAGQHLPLVIHLASRSISGHAQPLGTGHEAYHAAADSGFFQMFATNVKRRSITP